MITEQQILKATGDELGRIAGEVLQPDKNKHNCSNSGSGGVCSKCLKYIDWTLQRSECISADTITINWPNAMKWRDWAVGKFGYAKFYDAFTLVYRDYLKSLGFTNTGFLNSSFVSFIIIDAQPEHYIKAVLLTVESERK